MGTTKVFLKESPYDRLEALRAEKLSGHATLVKAFGRMHHARHVRLCRKLLLDAAVVGAHAAWKVSQAVLRQKELERLRRRIRVCVLVQREARARASERVRHQRYLLRALTTVQGAARAMRPQAMRQVMLSQCYGATVVQAACRQRLAAWHCAGRRATRACTALQSALRARASEGLVQCRRVVREQQERETAVFLRLHEAKGPTAALVQAFMRAVLCARAVAQRRVEVEGKRGGAEPWLNVPKTKRKVSFLVACRGPALWTLCPTANIPPSPAAVRRVRCACHGPRARPRVRFVQGPAPPSPSSNVMCECACCPQEIPANHPESSNIDQQASGTLQG